MESRTYSKGKFGSDGHFDSSLVGRQCGAAVLLRVMVDQGLAVALRATAHV